MNKVLTIREYQKIYADDCPHFNELVKFAEAGEFLTLNWNYVQAKNYVGVIRLPSGFQIEILPKINAPEDKLRGLVIKMICTLKDFSDKKFLNADLDTTRMNLYEIFIRIYLEQVAELVKRGLKSSYVVREDNLNFLKGKLLVNRQVRKNFVHREKFFVTFDEYSLSCAENRLIKAALCKLRRERLARRLLTAFDSVEPSKNFAADFLSVTHNKLNRDYEVVMAWTKIFLGGKSFTSFAGESEALAILFPMERLFEAYVAAHAKKIFSDRFSVKTQVRENFLFDEPCSYGLKPDILLEGAEKIILDTKWKIEPTPADMYQMFAYSKRYGAKKIFLLCPPDTSENFFRAADGFNVKICSVDLFELEKLRGII